MKNRDVDTAKIIAVIFAKTYEAKLNVLKRMEVDKIEYCINFCNTFEIGFTSGDNEEDEKQGNFCIFMKDLNKPMANNEKFSVESSYSLERGTTWLSSNVGDSSIISFNDIANEALKLLIEKDVDICISATEIIIPIFVLTYQSMIGTLTTRRKDSDEFEISLNFMGLFEIKCIENADGGDDIISIIPSPYSKLGLKDDDRETATKE